MFFCLCCFVRVGTYPNIRQTLIWSVKNIEVSSWKKVILDLPTDVAEYKLLLEGEYNKTSSYWSRNYVTVDHLELRSCSIKGSVHVLYPLYASFGTIKVWNRADIFIKRHSRGANVNGSSTKKYLLYIPNAYNTNLRDCIPLSCWLGSIAKQVENTFHRMSQRCEK